MSVIQRVKNFFANSWGLYKYMAFIVGTALIPVTIAYILKITIRPEFKEAIWYHLLFQIHGLVFMIYLVATFNLSIKRNWELSKMLLVMLAGVIPLMSFFIEARLAKEHQ